jgi:hypothetical protein
VAEHCRGMLDHSIRLSLYYVIARIGCARNASKARKNCQK